MSDLPVAGGLSRKHPVKSGTAAEARTTPIGPTVGVQAFEQHQSGRSGF